MDDELLEELELPDGVRDADDAVEVLRTWVADGTLCVIFDPETFRHDASEWGRLLSDIAHHLAHAIELDGQMSSNEAIAAIKTAFEAGIQGEAPAMTGRIKGRTTH